MDSLAANGFQFDYWDVGEGNPEGAPPLAVLQRYPMVIWFNGYDWFNPLTTAEEERLQTYLDGGGRLILTSQEYLFNLPDHAPSPFAQTYLGVYTHSEVLSSTLAVGVPGNPVGDQLGPYPLVFPLGYQNWTDTITPTAQASRALLSQDGLANAVTHSGGLTETWHTAFFSFGLELLDPPDMAELMRRAVGWLSWLGASTVAAGVEMAADNQIIPYTAVLRNDGPADIQSAVFTATFPPPLSLVPGSASGGATEVEGQVVWRGPLAKKQARTLTYQALVDADTPYGTLSQQISWLGVEDQDILFDRMVAVPVNAPDWSSSRLQVRPLQARLGEVLTYTLSLTNTGLADAPLVTITNAIPPYLQVLTGTVSQNQGTANLSQLAPRAVTWFAPLTVGQQAVFTYAARLIAIPYPFTLTNTFLVDDGFLEAEAWTATTSVIPARRYLPLIFKP